MYYRTYRHAYIKRLTCEQRDIHTTHTHAHTHTHKHTHTHTHTHTHHTHTHTHTHTRAHTHTHMHISRPGGTKVGSEEDYINSTNDREIRIGDSYWYVQ